MMATKDIDCTKSKGMKFMGNYVLGGTLGEGEFGKVKRAQNLISGQQVRKRDDNRLL